MIFFREKEDVHLEASLRRRREYFGCLMTAHLVAEKVNTLFKPKRQAKLGLIRIRSVVYISK